MMKNTYSRRSVMVGAAASAAVLTAAPLRAQDPTVHEVHIRSFSFDPDKVQVQVGDTIRWINHDLAPHTATADEFGWDTEEISKGEFGEVIVTKDMETSYFCVFHPHMKGTIEIL
ncbi:cupredoxin domain-containing protein [Shimia sp.]|uniref:cupredoxin domain-containing protein n=1 Tax=Shimia sp. TaxID=1954381 RepID=UPI003BAC7899